MKFVTLSLVALLILLQVKLFTGNGSILQVHALQKEVNQQQQLAQSLKERNQTLEAEVQDLKYRLDALEERARTDLGMVRSKESFFQYATAGE
ncbi:MAG: septum formation initiator family protein [Proteobacteria bacterium]|nr:septum formation initiator family protein [Pseudomonadota bacterium]